MKGDKKYFSQDAVKKEMESLHSNEVWELVSPPENRKVIESIWIGQPGYASRALKRFGMTDCKPVSPPVDVRLKLQKESDSPEFDHHSIKEQVYNGTVQLKYCQTNKMLADILKGLSCEQREN